MIQFGEHREEKESAATEEEGWPRKERCGKGEDLKDVLSGRLDGNCERLIEVSYDEFEFYFNLGADGRQFSSRRRVQR